MGRWQSKILLSLIVYFAGFCTAVYVLAPAEQRPSLCNEPTASAQVSRAGIREEDLVRCKEAMGRGVDLLKNFAEENTVRTAEFFRQHLERQRTGDG